MSKYFFLCVSSFCIGECILLLLSAEDVFNKILLMSLIINLIVSIVIIGFYKKKKVLSYSNILLILIFGFLYSSLSAFAYSEGGWRYKMKWVYANEHLLYTKKKIMEYIGIHEKCPNKIEDLNGNPIYFSDPYGTGFLKYKYIDDICIVYSLGMDYIDGEGKVELREDSIKEDIKASLLSYSILRTFYKLKYDKSKILGDIVIKIKITTRKPD